MVNNIGYNPIVVCIGLVHLALTLFLVFVSYGCIQNCRILGIHMPEKQHHPKCGKTIKNLPWYKGNYPQNFENNLLFSLKIYPK